MPFFFNCTCWKQRAADCCPLSHSHMLSDNETVISHSHSTPWLQRTGTPPELAVSRPAFQITSSVRHYEKLYSQMHLGILFTECVLGGLEYILVYACICSQMFLWETKKCTYFEPCFPNFVDHSLFPSTMKHPLTSHWTQFVKHCSCVVSPLPQFST